MVINTRFAPSPTGFLHIGSIRTALFSWLYAKHHGGKFILRIEDTDQVRSTTESITAILEGMAWLGLSYDVGPIYQTQRYARYKQAAEQLVSAGKAYLCECSKERLEKLRQAQLSAKQKPRYDECCRHKNLVITDKADKSHVIRFKSPRDGYVSFQDQVYGIIQIANQELDDLILVRSDGHPTYNFAVVIDDWDMAITHVIRGDDHINNTPRQINLFKALGANIPIYAHLPMILGQDGKRLSKRHGAVNVLEFKELGFLPHALLNYLVRLGWSHGDQEIFTLDEMINYFDLSQVSRGAASFNYEKLCWLNQYYQKHYLRTEVATALQWHFQKKGINTDNGPKLIDLIDIQAERCKTLEEICDKSIYFYQDEIKYDEKAMQKYLTPSILPALEATYNKFQQILLWEKEQLQACINDVGVAFDLNMSKIAQPLRVTVTGNAISPPIDITLKLLGKQRTLSRLRHIINQFKQ